jgi:hypothetical protein
VWCIVSVVKAVVYDVVLSGVVLVMSCCVMCDLISYDVIWDKD